MATSTLTLKTATAASWDTGWTQSAGDAWTATSLVLTVTGAGSVDLELSCRDDDSTTVLYKQAVPWTASGTLNIPLPTPFYGQIRLRGSIQAGGTVAAAISGELPKLTLSSDGSTLVASQPMIQQMPNGSKLAAFAAGYANMRVVTVGAGGMFARLQDAINSIVDASEANQYDIRILSNLSSSSLTDLVDWEVPERYNTETANITGQVAYVVTKSWVHIRGYGAKRTVSFVSPTTLTAASYQYINNLHPRGNCIIADLRFELTGGRYAGHQESNGASNHMDYHATTEYRRCVFEHFGNSTAKGYPSGAWSAQCAMANGVNSGLTQIFDGCEWRTAYTTPFYWHSNPKFDAPYKVIIRNCNVIPTGTADISAIAVYQSDLGSGVIPEVEISNSNLLAFNYGSTSRETESVPGGADDVRAGIPEVTGGGNFPHVTANRTVQSLYATASANNVKIIAASGSALPLIWGDTLKSIAHSASAANRIIGSKRIALPTTLGTSYVYSLAYRLGNCAESPKTIIFNVGGVDRTITFNKNYMTADGSPYTAFTVPALSDASIVADMNTQAVGFTVALNALIDQPTVPGNFEIGINNGATWITNRNLLVRDRSAGWGRWKVATAGDRVEGFAAGNIGPGQEGRILLAKKCMVLGPWGITPTIGKYYYVSASNTIAEGTGPSDSSLLCVGTNLCIGI